MEEIIEMRIMTEVGIGLEKGNTKVQTSAVSDFDQVSPATMAKAQTKDSVQGLVIPYVSKGEKPKGLVISKIRCKAV